MNLDHKEVWANFYDEALADGMTEDEAELFANESTIDHFAMMADDAHDRAKERGT